ncbi:MAG: peptidase M16, partial [Candidatus Competibacteraceae bacterium]|nr:peptidase M16 [Candidatus Competibacteraceae bacterium]
YGQPQYVETGYLWDSEDDPRDKTHIVLGWLLGKTTDPRAVMEARLLSDALLDNSSSPLRYALETSGLGAAPSPLCGFDDSTRETTFVCGLEGSNPEQSQAVEDLMLGVLSDVAERGIPVETLESVLHQMELSEREITGDGFPYGLRLQLEALTPAIHGGDPVAALNSGPLLDALREEINNPEFIKQLARRLLLNNPHRVRLVMAPDRTLSAARLAAEKQRLANLKAALDEQAKHQVIEQGQALQIRQKQQDDPELLPRVGLEDVPEELKIPTGVGRPVGDLPITWYESGTNGMVYQQLVVDLPELDDSLLDVLPLFTACLSEVGSGGRDYLTTQALQAAVTGGISARCLVRGELDDIQQTHGVLVVAGKALARNQAALTELLTETFVSPRFDELSRLRELIDQLCAQREEDITQHGHALAILAASAGLSPTAALAHRWEGLLGLQRLRALNDTVRQNSGLTHFAARLETLCERLKTAPRQVLVVSEEEHQNAMADSLARCWASYPNPTSASKLRMAPTHTRLQQGWGTSTQVNFCAKAYPSVSQSHPDAPALQVLGDFLRNGYLHRAIREQGGAYGAGAGYHTDSGTFRFYSYRDPRCLETLDDFDRALEWLETADHPPRAVEEAILGVVASIDKPGSPAGEAINAFFGDLFGRTADQRREYRSKILQVTLQDLKRVATTYLQPDQASSAVVSDVGKIGQLTGWDVATI